jgi:hypothetical protein
MEKFIQIPDDLRQDSNIRRIMNFACTQKADRYTRKNVAEHQVRYYEAQLETSRQELLEAERGVEEIESTVETLIDTIRQWIVVSTPNFVSFTFKPFADTPGPISKRVYEYTQSLIKAFAFLPTSPCSASTILASSIPSMGFQMLFLALFSHVLSALYILQ